MTGSTAMLMAAMTTERLPEARYPRRRSIAMGKVIDLWPRTATGYSPDGYTWSFGALFILQLAGLAWLALSQARPLAEKTAAAAAD